MLASSIQGRLIPRTPPSLHCTLVAYFCNKLWLTSHFLLENLLDTKLTNSRAPYDDINEADHITPNPNPIREREKKELVETTARIQIVIWGVAWGIIFDSLFSSRIRSRGHGTKSALIFLPFIAFCPQGKGGEEAAELPVWEELWVRRVNGILLLLLPPEWRVVHYANHLAPPIKNALSRCILSFYKTAFFFWFFSFPPFRYKYH